MSLLDKARKVPVKKSHKWNKDHFELTEAWLNGEISLMQIAHVISSPNAKKIHQNNAANMVMYCLRSMRRLGLIKIVEEK